MPRTIVADMSLADVARLAHVERPVVSMWRRRYRDRDLPFPDPTTGSSGKPAFDVGQVGRWLRATGLGNNPDAHLDADAFASGTSVDDVETDALTALLCLKVLSGERLRGLSSGEILDLADDHDPHNVSLYSELETAVDNIAFLAGTADALTDAAYSAGAAFDQLLMARQRHGLRAADLQLTAVELVAAAASALADPQVGRSLVVDHSPGSSDILLQLSQGDVAFRCALAWGESDTTEARRGLRRLYTHGLVPARWRDQGEHAAGGEAPGLHLVQYPHPDAQHPSDADVLNAIERIGLQFTDGERAVVLGPASALCDPLGSGGSGQDAETVRSAILRTGRLRAVVRLPAGLLKSKPRQAMALWVLGPAHADVAISERWTMVADLSAVSLSQTVIADLTGDLAAAMGNRRSVDKHAFRFARLVGTSSMLAARGSLVRVRARSARRTVQPAEAVLRIEDLISSLGQPATPQKAARLRVSQPLELENPAVRALGDLADDGAVTYLAGNRIEAEDLHQRDLATPGSIRVITLASLLEADPPAAMDRLRFAAQYPAGRLTEPGDVVFCTGPRPAALVDAEGSAAVAYPARILRIGGERKTRKDPPGLVARLLAADINAQPPTARQWRSWTVRTVDVVQRDLLSSTLDAVEQQRLAALERLSQLDQLATLIMDGVASNTVTLGEYTPAAPMEGTPQCPRK